MLRITLAEKLEDCIQHLAGEVLREVKGLTDDEKNVHYLCRSIENLVRVYAEDAKPPQKRLAHERLNRYLHRLQQIPPRSSGFRVSVSGAVRSVGGLTEARVGATADSHVATPRTERRFKRRPIFR